MGRKLMKVKWEDLQVGDIFAEDNAQVKTLHDWEQMPCYALETTVDGGIETTIVGETHLIAVPFDNIGGKPNLEFETTKKSHKQGFKQCINWLSIKDAYEQFKKDGEDYAELQAIGGVAIIRPYKGFEPQKCRCIETDTGVFMINGLTYGNSARGDHDLLEMKDIVADLSRSGMTDQWIAHNLFLDKESITRFKQLAGMRAAFNTEENLSNAWDPIADGNAERRKNINLTQAARRYIRKYRALAKHDGIPYNDKDTDVLSAARDLGWDKDNPNEIPKSLDASGKVFEKELSADENGGE